MANGRVYVPSYKQLQIFGLRPWFKKIGVLPNRFAAIEQTRPEIVRPKEIPGAAYWGTVKSVNGNKITILLRTGKTLTVDLSEATKAGTTIDPVVGEKVAANGTLNEYGTLSARTLNRAKDRASWGTDTEK